MRKAICVGINNYPGSANDLNGCVNDANDWSNLLESFDFDTQMILDSQATKANILNTLDSLIKQATADDVIVFTYSGHGTSVLDTNADEADGYDEALYVYDGVLLDDELRVILQNVNTNIHIVIIADSCFSGTVTRALSEPDAKIRYIQTDSIPSNLKLRKKFMSEEEMVEILISGCSDSEYSYDAYINERYNGAFTANALNVLKADQTYNEFYALLREKLPSTRYPQTPQLEGSTENKNRKIFEYDPVTGIPEPEPGPEPRPEPEPQKSSWLSKYWWVILLIVIIVIILWGI